MPRKIIPAEVPEGHKWCFGCSQPLPVQRFTVDRSKVGGRHHACRKCADRKRRERGEVRRMMDETYARLSTKRITREP